MNNLIKTFKPKTMIYTKSLKHFKKLKAKGINCKLVTNFK